MLTVVTVPFSTAASKWFSEVLKAKTSNASPPLNGFQADSIFVGLVAEENPALSHLHNRVKAQDRPLDMLSISVGGDCLMLADISSKAVREFLNHPRVVVFGTDMGKLSKRLETIQDVTIRRGVDLNELAVVSFDRPELDLGRYDFDRLTAVVLGQEHYVMKPAFIDWSPPAATDEADEVYQFFSVNKVLFTSVVAYLRLQIGIKLGHMMDRNVEVPGVKIPALPKTKREGKTREKSPKPGKSDAEEAIKQAEAEG